MIPPPWVGVVLALAVYRLCRLAGWDDFPPVAKVRAWVVGEEIVNRGSTNARLGVTDEPVLYGTTFRRPTLEHFLHCPFCLGFWLSVAAYLGWRFEPHWSLTLLAPFALSAAVGLVARNLDP